MGEILLFIAGFVFLFKGADFLVTGASALARKMKVPDLVIGLTVVSFGTSIAELFVNVFASMEHNNDIAIGNVLGSNIVNVLLILGISAVISPLKVTDNTVWKEIPMGFFAAVLFFVLANDRVIEHAPYSMLSRIDGVVLLSFFLIFICYAFELAKGNSLIAGEPPGPLRSLFFITGAIGFGLFALIIGAQWVVQGAVYIARAMHVSNVFIGLTVVAVGTSLPELATSVTAASRGKADIAVGNVVGSNIFNIFFILGVSALINPILYNTANNFDTVVCAGSSLLIFVFMFMGEKKKFGRPEGVILMLCYGAYLAALFIRG